MDECEGEYADIDDPMDFIGKEFLQLLCKNNDFGFLRMLIGIYLVRATEVLVSALPFATTRFVFFIHGF